MRQLTRVAHPTGTTVAFHSICACIHASNAEAFLRGRIRPWAFPLSTLTFLHQTSLTSHITEQLHVHKLCTFSSTTCLGSFGLQGIQRFNNLRCIGEHFSLETTCATCPFKRGTLFEVSIILIDLPTTQQHAKASSRSM